MHRKRLMKKNTVICFRCKNNDSLCLSFHMKSKICCFFLCLKTDPITKATLYIISCLFNHLLSQTNSSDLSDCFRSPARPRQRSDQNSVFEFVSTNDKIGSKGESCELSINQTSPSCFSYLLLFPSFVPHPLLHHTCMWGLVGGGPGAEANAN